MKRVLFWVLGLCLVLFILRDFSRGSLISSVSESGCTRGWVL